MSVFNSLAALEILPIWDGVTARAVEGREMTFAVVELAPHAVVAQHQHPNEQVGIVLKGSLRFNVAGESRELHVGDTYVIPTNVPHEATAGSNGCVVVDVFAPLRGDWRRFQPEPARAPLWP
jgi:quercetin dioxygenase-like cupin family protein